jgi:hypothetical protein
MENSPDTNALLEDYKLKVDYAVQQTGRAQTQFQVMLTLESALATALIVSNTGSLTQGAIFIVGLEVILSVAWAVVGWSARERGEKHRDDLEAAGREWARVAGLGLDYRIVGGGTKVQKVGFRAPLALSIGWAAFFVVLLVLRLN